MDVLIICASGFDISEAMCLMILTEYDDTMPPKRSREEILRRKREAEKTRMLKIKNDPIKLAEYKEKEKQKYLKKIEKGQRKRINQMTDREKRSTR
ncbi:unnamed protein product [Callosobruchus maculatus]|uniref:Uncharacterized protein n=1 Tax=Callosobruchus maculatus TaxID=64391 RepID=A0A653D6R7_CALMS|nr:unnamed protein product [Callosobruchus maculatus]